MAHVVKNETISGSSCGTVVERSAEGRGFESRWVLGFVLIFPFLLCTIIKLAECPKHDTTWSRSFTN